jgi:prepilin-type N-terminal cleavage/methylation domain-containing protein
MTGMARMQRITRRLRDEQSGFTLIELVVASMLTVVIAVVIGNILITTLGSEKTVRTTTQATSAGQLVAQSIDKGVRNAVWISPLPYATGGDYFLTVRTADGKKDVTYTCQAWYITAAGSAYVRSSDSPILKPTGGNVTGWTLLTTGIERSGAQHILDSSLAGQVDIHFEVDAGDAPNVLISTSALSRQNTTGTSPCA